jgi:hypothetical protein
MNLKDKTKKQKEKIAQNTFLLALDGDVDFQPSAVQLLVDRMKKNLNVGAACGRIHPIGSGNISLYQTIPVNRIFVLVSEKKSQSDSDILITPLVSLSSSYSSRTTIVF